MRHHHFRCTTSAAFGLALVTFWGWSGTADAHLGHIITRAERYLKIDATPADTRVVVSITFGAREGRRVLNAADRDRNGEVSEAERDRYLQEWAVGLQHDLPIALNGSPHDASWTDGFLAPIGEVQDIPLTAEMTVHLRLHGTCTLSVEDGMRMEVFDRTDVAFRAREGAELLGTGLNGVAEGLERDLAYGPSHYPIPRITARLRLPDIPAPNPRPWTRYLATALLLGGLVGLWRIRQRRRPS